MRAACVVKGWMGAIMADRKQFHSHLAVNPELQALLDRARTENLTEDELREQRVSFAFGNAPYRAELITRESVIRSSQSIRLKQ